MFHVEHIHHFARRLGPPAPPAL